eukprot:Gb_01477 [translate_table: standard]
MFSGILQVRNAHYTLQHNICFRVMIVVNHPRTINQEDTLGKSDVLPYFCLSWYRCYFAHIFGPQSVNYGRFANIRISNEANRYRLLVILHTSKLPKKGKK